MGHGLKALLLVLSLGMSAPSWAVQFTNRSFEQGDLTGWTTYGDVSVQTAPFGSPPTHGNYMAVLSTLGNDPTGYSGEVPISNTPAGGVGPLWGFPVAGGPGYVFLPMIESSVIRQTVALRAGQTVLFDWNHAGEPVDRSWVFVPDGACDQSTGLGEQSLCGPVSFLGGDWFDGTRISNPSSIDLKPYVPGRPGWSGVTGETGWHTFSYFATADGFYDFYIGVNDMADPSIPTVLLLDNFRIRVPEPGTLALLSLGLFGLGLTRRKAH